jgi:hypothetical protein
MHKNEFYNPSPLAVIAGEYIGKPVRSTPLLVLSMLLPVTMGSLFGSLSAEFLWARHFCTGALKATGVCWWGCQISLHGGAIQRKSSPIYEIQVKTRLYVKPRNMLVKL